MPVLIAILSSVITFLAIILGFIFLRPKLWDLPPTRKKLRSFKAHIKNSKEVNQSDDSHGSSGKLWPIEISNKTDGKDLAVLVRSSDQGLNDCCEVEPVISRHDQVRDPVEFCGHIQREVKKTQQRITLEKIQSEMTREQCANEREIQLQQLQEIFRIMEDRKDKFGMSSVDDVRQQMKLYIQ